VPNRNPAGGEALLEEIKFRAGQQEGFDLLFQLLTGSKPTEVKNG